MHLTARHHRPSTPAVVIAAMALVLASVARPGGQAPARDILNRLAPDSGRTQVLVLGTPHLASLGQEWNPAALDRLLSTLDGFRPDVIAVERMPPHIIRSLETLGGRYADVATTMVGSVLRHGAAAQSHLGIGYAAAVAEAAALLTRVAQTPDGAERDRLRQQWALHLVAAYDEPTALLQWSYLPEAARLAGDAGPADVVAHLNRLIGNPNETSSIAAALARRRGLQRLVSMDDHQEAAVTLEFWDEVARDVGATVEYAAMKNAPIYAESSRRFTAAYADRDLLPHYLWINSPAFTAADVDQQFGLFLRTRLPSGLDRARLALWEVRNMRMAAHVREVGARHPGGRVLVIVGVAHKPFMDQYLGQAADLTLVQLDSIVGER